MRRYFLWPQRAWVRYLIAGGVNAVLLFALAGIMALLGLRPNSGWDMMVVSIAITTFFFGWGIGRQAVPGTPWWSSQRRDLVAEHEAKVAAKRAAAAEREQHGGAISR